MDSKNKQHYDFSQQGEQAVITGYFRNNILSFLDIGAYNGIWCSNTHALALQGWSGTCIEANPAIFVNLMDNYKDFAKISLVNAAIALNEEITQFHMADAVSSTDKEHIRQFAELYKQIRTIYIPTITLDWVKRFMQSHYDFISVDVEGQSIEIFARAVELFSPKLICVEHEHRHSDVLDAAGNNYKEIFRNDINSIFERK